MENVGHRESPSREYKIGSYIFARIDGEGTRIWSTNGGKTIPSGGGYGVGMSAIARSGTTCGAITSGGK